MKKSDTYCGRRYDRAGKRRGDRVHQEILTGMTDLHVYISDTAASVLRRCACFDGADHQDHIER